MIAVRREMVPVEPLSDGDGMPVHRDSAFAFGSVSQPVAGRRGSLKSIAFQGSGVYREESCLRSQHNSLAVFSATFSGGFVALAISRFSTPHVGRGMSISMSPLTDLPARLERCEDRCWLG
jgi:hypothetical protein